MTARERRQHVLELTDELGAMVMVDEEIVCSTLGCQDGINGYAQRRTRPFPGAKLLPPLVVLAAEPGESETAYLVALHELGHIATKFAGATFDREAVAWDWAVERARELTACGWGQIAKSLSLYRAHCKRCKPSKDFDRLLAQAERNAE